MRPAEGVGGWWPAAHPPTLACCAPSLEGAVAGIRLVNSRGVALRHTREGDEKDIWDGPRVDDLVHFARSLDERLPRAVGGGLAPAANRFVDGERARLYDDDRAPRMAMPAGGAAWVDGDLRHGYVRSDLERDGPM